MGKELYKLARTKGHNPRQTQRDTVDFMTNVPDAYKISHLVSNHAVRTIADGFNSVLPFHNVVRDEWGDDHEEDSALWLEMNT